MADYAKLASELAEILIAQSGYYRLALLKDFADYQQNQQSRGKTGRTAAEITALAAAVDTKATASTFSIYAQQYARKTVDFALGGTNAPKMDDPISVAEISLRRDLHLYRAYDGVKAFPRSSWWIGTSMLRKITQSSPARRGGAEGKRAVLDFMLSSSFVHPDWNTGKQVARMTVPAGKRLPIISGSGSWKTMAVDKAPITDPSKQGVAAIEGWDGDPSDLGSEENRIMLMGMLPVTGPRQTFVPLFEQAWISEIDENSSKWPFA